MKRIFNWNKVPLVLSTEETESLLGIEARVLRKMAREKKIPAKKVNKEWRFLKEEIYSWLKDK